MDLLTSVFANPRTRTLLFAGIAVLLLMLLNLPETGIGALLAPVIGEGETSGLWGRFACAVVLVAFIWITLFLLKLMPKAMGIACVWAGLLVLFLYFFYSFGLDLKFIQSKLLFMITQGAFTTLYISLISIGIASVIAMAVALARLSSNPLLFGTATFYISFFRGLPLLMQIFLIYIGLPQLGYVVDPIPAGIAALAICYGAYMAEIFRAGIIGVPAGQGEAAEALGLSKFQTFIKIIMPQAMKLIVPPTGNQFIAMLKDSSLVSVVGIWELTYLARNLGKKDFKHVELLITAALIYWSLSIVFELIQSRIEKHYGKGDRR